MNFLWRLVRILAVNAIVIWGLRFSDWSGPTALAVYWFENATNAVFITLLILVHRRLTRKRGHFRAQLGLQAKTGRGNWRKRNVQSFWSEYFFTTTLFTAAHGFFLGAFLIIALKSYPDMEACRRGALMIGACQLAGFAVDLVGVRNRPFSWLKQIAHLSLARVVLIHIAIIAGIGWAAMSGNNDRFFVPFAVLKLLAEIGMLFRKDSHEGGAPRWLMWFMNRIAPQMDFAGMVEAEHAKELARQKIDEQVMP